MLLVKWRFLLAACFVFAAGLAYLITPLTNSNLDASRLPGLAPALFQRNYHAIQGAMAEDQLRELLGPPTNRAEIDASAWLFWRDGENNGCAVWILGDTVAAKKSWRAGEAVACEWEDLPR